MERRWWPGSALAALGVVALLGPPSAPAAVRIASDDTVPLVSGNVTPLATLPVGKPVGARFRDNYMFVTGTDGVTAYDVSDPALPKPQAFLPLPHFENEDVDLGGNVLLVSNDPSEGVGVLYVIDISKVDQHVLTVTGVLQNGFIADGGLTGIFFGDAVTYPLPVGTGHTVSCVNPACTYAYMAGTDHGITIVDLRDPAKPAVAVPEWKPDITGLTTHDVQVDSDGLAWIVGAEGTAAYDVTDPVHPKLVMRTDEAVKNSGQLGFPTVEVPDNPATGEIYFVGGNGENPIDLIHHDSLRLGTVEKAPPVSVEVARGGAGSGGNFGKGDGGGELPSSGSGTVIAPGWTGAKPRTTKARKKKAAKKRHRKARRGCRTKRQKRAKRCRVRARAARATTRRATGFRLAPFKQQTGKTYPAGGDSPLLGVVEEDYNRPTCQGAGEFQLWGVTNKKTSKGARKLELLDRHQTELGALASGRGWAPVTGLCSAHYFDYRDGIVAGGWYEEGTRFLDVRDPANIRQVGYWVPTKGETWSVVFPPTDPSGEIVYALDFARGIDVLRLDRSDLRPREAPVRRSWISGDRDAAGVITGASKRSRFGFVCRLPVSTP
jgi:hypothetical protein